MGYFVSTPGPPRDPSQRPVEGEDEAIAIVPFVPWRCPKCGSTSPRTYGQRGRYRYHLCAPCGLRFRSIELGPQHVKDLENLLEP